MRALALAVVLTAACGGVKHPAIAGSGCYEISRGAKFTAELGNRLACLPPETRVEIFVDYRGDDPGALIALGFEPFTKVTHPTKHYTISTGAIELGKVRDLAKLDIVQEIGGGDPSEPATASEPVPSL